MMKCNVNVRVFNYAQIMTVKSSSVNVFNDSLRKSERRFSAKICVSLTIISSFRRD